MYTIQKVGMYIDWSDESTLSSDWPINSLIMIVYEKLLVVICKEK